MCGDGSDGRGPDSVDEVVPAFGKPTEIGERFKRPLTVGKSSPAIHPSEFLMLVGH